MKQILHFLLIITVFLLASCVSTPDNPWVYPQHGSSPKTDFLITKWWMQSGKMDPSFHDQWQNRFDENGNNIFFEWWKMNFPGNEFFFLEYDKTDHQLTYQPKSIEFKHLSLLLTAADKMQSPITIEIKREEFHSYQWHRENLALSNEFYNWLSGISSPVLPESNFPTGSPGTRQDIALKIQKDIKHLVDDINLKIDLLLIEKKYENAFDECQRIVKEIPENLYTPTFKTMLAKAGNTLLEYKLNEWSKKKFISVKDIISELKQIYQIEDKFSSDDTVRAVFSPFCDRVSGIETMYGNYIGTIWHDQILNFARENRFWSAYEYCKDQLSALSELRPEVGKKARPLLWESFESILKDTFDHFSACAEQEIKAGNRYGSALIIGLICKEIYDFANQHNFVASRAAIDAFEKMKLTSLQCNEWIQNYNIYRRGLKINEFSPSGGQRGTEFRMELEILMAELLQDSNENELQFLKHLISNVHFMQASDSVTPTDYEVVNGLLSEPESSLTPPQETRYPVTLRGEIKTLPNPIYTDLTARGKSTVGIAPYYYEQTIYTYEIIRVVTEAITNSKVMFDISHNSETRRFRIDFEQKLKKEFINETYLPSEIKTRMERVEANTKGTEGTPVPELRKEKIWNELELLAWARKEALKLAVAEIVNDMAQLPVEYEALAVAQEKNAVWTQTAHFLGLTWAFSQPIEVDLSAVETFFKTEDGIVEHALPQKQKLQATMQKLQKIKNEAKARALHSGVMLLEPQRNPSP